MSILSLAGPREYSSGSGAAFGLDFGQADLKNGRGDSDRADPDRGEEAYSDLFDQFDGE